MASGNKLRDGLLRGYGRFVQKEPKVSVACERLGRVLWSASGESIRTVVSLQKPTIKTRFNQLSTHHSCSSRVMRSPRCHEIPLNLFAANSFRFLYKQFLFAIFNIDATQILMISQQSYEVLQLCTSLSLFVIFYYILNNYNRDSVKM